MSWEQRNADFCKAQTDAQMAYIEAEREVDRLQAENAKLLELISELWVSCPLHDSDCDECRHRGGRTGCELYDCMLKLGVV